MDAVEDDLRLASILRTTGWVLLFFNVIPASMIWVGFRSGSFFWLYWTIIEGVIGFGLITAGAYLNTNAGRHISRLGYERTEEREAA